DKRHHVHLAKPESAPGGRDERPAAPPNNRRRQYETEQAHRKAKWRLPRQTKNSSNRRKDDQWQGDESRDDEAGEKGCDHRRAMPGVFTVSHRRMFFRLYGGDMPGMFLDAHSRVARLSDRTRPAVAIAAIPAAAQVSPDRSRCCRGGVVADVRHAACAVK